MKNIKFFMALKTKLIFILLMYFNIFLQISLYKIQEKYKQIVYARAHTHKMKNYSHIYSFRNKFYYYIYIMNIFLQILLHKIHKKYIKIMQHIHTH